MGLFDNIFGGSKKPAPTSQQTNPAQPAAPFGNDQQMQNLNYPAGQPQVQAGATDSNFGVDPNQFSNAAQNFDSNLLPLDPNVVQQNQVQPQPVDMAQMPVVGSMPVMPPQPPIMQPQEAVASPDVSMPLPANAVDVTMVDNSQPQMPQAPADASFNKDWYTSSETVNTPTQPVEQTQATEPTPTFDLQNINIPNLNLPVNQPAIIPEATAEAQQSIDTGAGDILQTGISETSFTEPQASESPASLEAVNVPVQPATTELDLGVKETKIQETKLPPEAILTSDLAQKEADVVKAIEAKKTPSDKLALSIFQKIAIIGLNGPKVDMNKALELKEASKKLSSMGAKLLFDSKNGLGASVLDGLKESDGSGMGVYFRPFMSNLFSKVDKDIEPSNIVSFIYSNFVERLQFLMKESRLFVIVDSGGIHNYSQFMILWGMSYIYYGNHKPVVLYGADWKDTLEKLKTDMGLTQEEMESIKVVETPDQLISYIKELEQEYSKNPTSIEKVIDRRVEGDERDFLISK